MRLRGVLDDLQAVARGDLADRLHLHDAPVEVHDHYRLRARGDALLDQRGVDEERGRVWLNQNGRCAVGAYGDERRDVGVGGRNDLVAGADAERLHDEPQRVQPVRAADGVPRAAERGELALERRALVAEQVPAAVEDACRRGVHLGAEALVYAVQVEKRNHGALPTIRRNSSWSRM